MTCPACRIRFTDPITLTCGHNVCRLCATGDVDSTQCPQCGHVTQCPLHRIATNELLRDLLMGAPSPFTKCTLHCGQPMHLFCLRCRQVCCASCVHLLHRGHGAPHDLHDAETFRRSMEGRVSRALVDLSARRVRAESTAAERLVVYDAAGRAASDSVVVLVDALRVEAQAFEWATSGTPLLLASVLMAHTPCGASVDVDMCCHRGAVGDGAEGGPHRIYPRGIAAIGDDHLAVTDSANHRVQILRATDGCLVRSIGTSRGGMFDTPLGVAAVGDDATSLVVADHNNHRLVVILWGEGTVTRCIGSHGTARDEFDGPHGVAAVSDGVVAVGDFNNHRVQIVQWVDGTFLRAIGNGQGPGCYQFNGPWGITCVNSETIVVTDYNNARLQVVRWTDGTFLRATPLNSFRGPRGIATVRNDTVVVADAGRKRLQFVTWEDGVLGRAMEDRRDAYYVGSGRFVRLPTASPHTDERETVEEWSTPYDVTVLHGDTVVMLDFGNFRLHLFS